MGTVDERPMIVAEHVRDMETISSMQGHSWTFPAVTLRVEFRLGDHDAASEALNAAIRSVRAQIVDASERVLIAGPPSQDQHRSGS